MKEYSESELRNKAEAFCSIAEHCPSEVIAKLAKWGADEIATEHILLHLERERYIDTTRYCRFFVRDKYRFARWGKIKIKQALKMKGLPDEDIRMGLDEIDETEYENMLKDLLCQKKRSVTGKNGYERNAKLIRFAIGRGYAMEEIVRHVKNMEDEYLD